jgi:AcrR family transcriptional regulator
MARRPRAYTRLDVDERRRRLLDLGRSLFTTQPYDELSMSAIAREAGISKALLYHYFPSKQAYFVATLQEAAAQLADRVRPDEGRPPAEQLSSALDAWLGWVHENRAGYAKLLRGATGAPEVRELVDRVRDETASLIVARMWGNGGAAPAEVRVAVRGWLWFMDGACLDWVEHDDLDRAQMHELLLGALPAVVAAAGHPEVLDRLTAASAT